ncbi:MAG: SRPBCC family protein [Flavobacteriales bacterium]
MELLSLPKDAPMHVLKRETIVNAPLQEVWDFFSSPANLNRITPPDMSFEILSDLGPKMHTGMIVRYKVRPIANIPLGWVTEITHCEEGQYFVDEQRFGPYRFWHHQHHFSALADNRVQMKDVVHYDVGFGPLGRWMDRFYVKNRLENIFDYRAATIHDIFP